MKNRIIFIGIAILCFFLYGNTLTNDYALDDSLVLTQNQFTRRGFKGLGDIFTYDSFTGFFGVEKALVAGGRYRPLSLASLAVETEFFEMNPFISHLVNILMYILTCYLLYLVLASLIPNTGKKWMDSIPLLATFVFLVHPIHTEVVANIKGRDEMMILIFSLLATLCAIKLVDEEKPGLRYLLMLGSAVSLFLGFLSKENAITFLAIIPAALYVFKRVPVTKIIVIILPMVVATLLFLYIRHRVLGASISDPIDELMNNPFVYATTPEKYATILYTLGIYMKLLLFPHPLTYDYYPFHIKIVDWSNLVVIASTIAYLALIVYAIWGTLARKTGGFAALLFIASLSIVSNLVFPIGTFMNERFLFVSSIGFAIGTALVLRYIREKWLNQRASTIVIASFLGVVFILSSYKVISRNRAWKDDLTLFTTDVKVSFNSAKSTCSAGGKLFEAAKEQRDSTAKFKMLDESVYYLRRSVAIHPTYTDALLLLGNALFEYGMYDSTIYYYKRIANRAPYYSKVYENLPIVLNRTKDVDYKIRTYQFFDSIKKNDYDINYQLGTLWGKEKGNIPLATSYLEKAYNINQSRKEATKDLGVAYGFAQRTDEALKMFQKALSIDPNDDQIYYNIAILYASTGRTNEAQSYFAKSQELKQKKNAK